MADAKDVGFGINIRPDDLLGRRASPENKPASRTGRSLFEETRSRLAFVTYGTRLNRKGGRGRPLKDTRLKIPA
jgi:hypothetical protein